MESMSDLVYSYYFNYNVIKHLCPPESFKMV